MANVVFNVFILVFFTIVLTLSNRVPTFLIICFYAFYRVLLIFNRYGQCHFSAHNCTLADRVLSEQKRKIPPRNSKWDLSSKTLVEMLSLLETILYVHNGREKFYLQLSKCWMEYHPHKVPLPFQNQYSWNWNNWC